MLKGYKTNNMTSFNIQYSNFKNSFKIRKTKIGARDLPRAYLQIKTPAEVCQKQARPVLGSEQMNRSGWPLWATEPRPLPRRSAKAAPCGSQGQFRYVVRTSLGYFSNVFILD